jgi:hypothetical protein
VNEQGSLGVELAVWWLCWESRGAARAIMVDDVHCGSKGSTAVELLEGNPISEFSLILNGALMGDTFKMSLLWQFFASFHQKISYCILENVLPPS